MGRAGVTHGSHIGHPWTSRWYIEQIYGLVVLTHGSSMGLTWVCSAGQWVIHGSVMGSMGHSWVGDGSTMGYPGHPWITQGSSMGRPWGAHGSPVDI